MTYLTLISLSPTHGQALRITILITEKQTVASLMILFAFWS